ncbi:MAG TPA: hypothetical protein VLC92_16555 [Rhodocyclaceae bacterium]|nr:hypothetical protein [Rhodocyclaceae bacterium]
MKHKRANTFSGPVALSLCLLAISAAMLWFAHSARSKAVAERIRTTQEAQAATDRLRRTADDESLIRRTIDRFETLQQRGLIGPEHRLDWADRMRAIRERHRFVQLDFELSPQRIIGPLSTPGDYQLAASRMQIRAGLLHEGDFFDLITDLRTRPVSAIVAPRRCTLTPSSESTAQGINLRAECTVEWLTVTTARGSRP